MRGPGGPAAAPPADGLVAEPSRRPRASGRSGELEESHPLRFPGEDPDGAMDRYLVFGLLMRIFALAVPAVLLIALGA